MSPDAFHQIALPLFAAVGLTLLVMLVCAVLMAREGKREKAERRKAAP